MIFKPTRTHSWFYALIYDLTGELQGVKFYWKQGNGETYKVLFAGNGDVCLDWAGLPHDGFFNKYSRKGRAARSCGYAEYYIAEKALSMRRKKERKPIRLKMVSND